jgi:hypothetical protein
MIYSLFLKKKNGENVGDEAHILRPDPVPINHPTTPKRKADQ